MSTFTWPVKTGVALSKEPRVKTAAFGDGYQQRVASGINTMPRTWKIEIVQRRAVVAVAERFLATMGGAQSFDWLAPDGVAGKWVCRVWNVVYAGKTATLTADFEEVYGD